MSGIAGIYHLDGRPVDLSLLTRMTDVIAHRGPDGAGLWVQGAVGFACQLLRVTPESASETQPLTHSSGAVLVFDGRLDNREELLAVLKESAGIAVSSPDPALVLAAYDVFGDRFSEYFNGDFALGLFDPKRQQLLLVRDTIGVRPLYYWHTEETFLFASEIKSILAHPEVSTRPNDDVLAEFLLAGRPHDDGTMTCFAGVFCLPPAHMIILTSQGFVTRRYWDFDCMRQTRLRSFQEYAEAFYFHFEQAVRRRLRSRYPVAISVSGGLDSSAIFCLAETLRRRNPAYYPSNIGLSYTCGDWAEADESAFLVEIERAYDVKIERFPLIPMGFFNSARDEVWQIEYPLVDETGANVQHLLETAHQRGARVMLTGHWGDQCLFPQGYLIDLFRRLAWGQVRDHLKAYGYWLTDVEPAHYRQQFFNNCIRYHVPDVLRPLLRTLRRKIVGRREQRQRPWYTDALRQPALHRASTQTALGRRFGTVHARSLYEQATSQYYVLCMEWNNKLASMHGLEMAFPFLDRDLISFLMSIPGEIQTWQGVPKAILRESMPGVLPDAIAHRTWKADFTRIANESMILDYTQLLRCLESDGMAVRLGYLRGDVLREALAQLREQIRGPTCEITWRLAELLGLELWLQAFFGEKTNVKEAL